jgi:hypothetical protein
MLGGMIALGIGVHGWDSETCMAKFRAISENGLILRRWAKTLGIPIGIAITRVTKSLYATSPLEQAMQDAYPSPDNFFGLRRSTSGLQSTPRVAITTLVNKETKLLTNYHCGGSSSYLRSDSPSWQMFVPPCLPAEKALTEWNIVPEAHQPRRCTSNHFSILRLASSAETVE